jgi:hypothetical protein
MWAVILIYGSYFLSYSLTNFIGVQGVLIKGIWCWDYRAKPQIVNENHSSIYVGQLIQPKLGNTEFQSQCHKKKIYIASLAREVLLFHGKGKRRQNTSWNMTCTIM